MNATRTHLLLVTIIQDSVLRGYRVMDLRTDYNPLVKELALRALAGAPELAGAPWSLDVRIECAGGGDSVLALDAYAERGKLLASIAVPVSTFGWVARRMAQRLGLRGECTFEIATLEEDDPIVAAWRARDLDEAFAVDRASVGELRLPSHCVPGAPPWRSASVNGNGAGWLRCVFARRPFRAFLEAARRERKHERSWMGCGHVFVSPDSCSVAIEELVGPLPATAAGRGFIRTRGSQVAGVYQALGVRLVAYLHLHPRSIGSEAVTPYPSVDDHQLAWNLDRSAAGAIVLPIALFRLDPDSPGNDVAVHGYSGGLLRRIPLEVTYDE